MTVAYRALPAELPLVLVPADQSVVFDFAQLGAPFGVSGTWVVKVRSSVTDATPDLIPTVDTTNAGSGVIAIVFTEAQLAALIPAGAAEFTGRWGARLDGVPWFAGPFVVHLDDSR